MAPKTTTRIGVLLVDTVQLLDLSSIDLFHILSEPYVSIFPFLPESVKAEAVPMEIIYINQAGPNQVHECTANIGVRVHASISDKTCAPTKKGGEKTLDILLIPGPDPFLYKPTDAMNGFIKGHYDNGTDVLSVCTGIYPTGYAGFFHGKSTTGPRELLPDLRQKFPEANWEEKRWVSDGNLWSSGGITNGQDMVAAYIREKWPGPLAEAMLAAADVGDRPQEYPAGK
ncbi:ThiJ/PfpI family protein [Usnea florida]